MSAGFIPAAFRPSPEAAEPKREGLKSFEGRGGPSLGSNTRGAQGLRAICGCWKAGEGGRGRERARVLRALLQGSSGLRASSAQVANFLNAQHSIAVLVQRQEPCQGDVVSRCNPGLHSPGQGLGMLHLPPPDRAPKPSFRTEASADSAGSGSYPRSAASLSLSSLWRGRSSDRLSGGGIQHPDSRALFRSPVHE